MDADFPRNWIMNALSWLLASGLSSANTRRRATKLEMREKVGQQVKQPLFGDSFVPSLGHFPQRHENESHCGSSCCRPAQALSQGWQHSYP
jgi:hypothetical protein